jgi:hypothetical protein
MSRDYFTFHSYIRNNRTRCTDRFISFLGEATLNKLPNKVCSSKFLYDILRQDLDTYFKQSVFRETFMEYFKWKITSH